MPQSKVLHVAGSPVSQYYYMISVHYCRQMLAGASDAATKEAFDFMFAVVLPGGDWCLVSDLDEATIARVLASYSAAVIFFSDGGGASSSSSIAANEPY